VIAETMRRESHLEKQTNRATVSDWSVTAYPHANLEKPIIAIDALIKLWLSPVYHCTEGGLQDE